MNNSNYKYKEQDKESQVGVVSFTNTSSGKRQAINLIKWILITFAVSIIISFIIPFPYSIIIIIPVVLFLIFYVRRRQRIQI